ncbi:MAG: hypothetical protein SGJ05_12375 [bacterium]|nr:hypothetical protein [bacterium]
MAQHTRWYALQDHRATSKLGATVYEIRPKQLFLMATTKTTATTTSTTATTLGYSIEYHA